jgi:hypothetical protein
MNPKTKEAIAEVLEDLDLRLKFNRDEALAKICAIVEKEREGEVVIADGKVDWEDMAPRYSNCAHQEYTVAGKSIDMDRVDGKKGRLIFVPDQEVK